MAKIGFTRGVASMFRERSSLTRNKLSPDNNRSTKKTGINDLTKDRPYWGPHNRTGIYIPQGHEKVLNDVPDNAATLDRTCWFRNDDGIDKPTTFDVRRWMTSASELFHITRRSRFGVGSRHVTNELEPDQRTFTHHHHRRNNHRNHDTIIDANVVGCRRFSRHHHNHSLSGQERDRVRVDEGSEDSSLGDSRINLDNFGGVENRGRRRLVGNDRLPGAVVLARERLLERLRGVSLSANRRNNRASSRSSRNGLIVGNNYTLADSNEDHWNTETLRETLDRVLFTDSIDLTDQLSMTRSMRRPSGLTQNALTHLQLEVFTEPWSCEDGEKLMSRASQECSICLETFAKGDQLVCLPCAHKFHFVCLEPWVRICGDCPYCRREIVVS